VKESTKKVENVDFKFALNWVKRAQNINKVTMSKKSIDFFSQPSNLDFTKTFNPLSRFSIKLTSFVVLKWRF